MFSIVADAITRIFTNGFYLNRIIDYLTNHMVIHIGIYIVKSKVIKPVYRHFYYGFTRFFIFRYFKNVIDVQPNILVFVIRH